MSFVTAPLAVAGVLAMAIPIVIFLLWRQRRTPIEWAAMRFLLEAFRKHRRRLQLEQLLLLAIRCLIVAILGFALARPLLKATGVLGGGSRIVYLVIDDGLASGLAPEPESSALADHVQTALDLIERLEPGDRVGLITAARPARAVVSPPSTDHAGVAKVLRGLAPRASSTSLAGAMHRLRLALHEIEGDERVFVYLLSEFRAGSAPLDEALPELNVPGTQVTLLANPPAQDPVDNVQVASVEPARSLILPGATDGSGQITVRLARQSGELNRAITTVRLVGDGISRTEPEVLEWTPGQSEGRVQFLLDIAAQRERETGISVLIDDDPLRADNERHAVLALRKTIRVVLVDRRSFGHEPALDQLTAGQWIRLALEPVETSPVETIEIEPAALEPADLRIADVAMLPRPDLITDRGWPILRRFVAGGGLLVVMPPADVNVHHWPDRLRDALGLPWEIAREVTVYPDGLALAAEQPSTDLLRMILGDLPELTPPIVNDRVLHVSTPDTESQAVLLLEDGSPLMLAASPRADSEAAPAPETPANDTGHGLVVYLAVAPELEWTNLPSKPLMVPLCQELLRQGLSMIRGRRPVWVGERPALAVGPAAARLLTPAGNRLMIDDIRRPEQPLDEPGLHRVLDAAAQPVGVVAVNVDPTAGRAEPQPAGSILTWLGAAGPWTLFDADDLGAALRRAESGSPLSGLLLLVLLGLIFLETILARRFSHAERVRDQRGLRSTIRLQSGEGIAAGGGGAS